MRTRKEKCQGRTRQELMLQSFPNATLLKNGALDICPEHVDARFKCVFYNDCADCKKKFWMQEVTESE